MYQGLLVRRGRLRRWLPGVRERDLDGSFPAEPRRSEGQDVPRGTLDSILRQAGLKRAEPWIKPSHTHM